MDQATLDIIYMVVSTLFSGVVYVAHRSKSNALNSAQKDLSIVQNVALPKVQAELDQSKKLLALIIQKAKDNSVDEASFQTGINIIENMIAIAENKPQTNG